MLAKFKSYLESIRVTPISWLAGISGILVVRFFLEPFSNPSLSGFFASDASTLVHYYTFFLAMALIMMVFIQIVLPSWKQVIPQLTLLSFVAILISPIVDWAVTAGKGMRMAYLYGTPQEMLFSFLTFGGKSFDGGATIGLRIEVVLGVLLMGTFVYLVSKNRKRSIVSALILYVIIFALTSIPGTISIIGQGWHPAESAPVFLQYSIINSSTVLNNLHSSLQYSSALRMFEIAFNFMMGKILFLILVAAAFVWFRLNFKEKFIAVLKNSRLEKVGFCMLLIFLGLFLAHIKSPIVGLNWNDWLSVITLCLSFYFSIIFAICINDMADVNIDVVSSPSRPLITGALTKEDMKWAASVSLVASLISGFLAGYTAFFFVLVLTALYYIYSAPPTRFKLVPFFSSFIVSLCCLTPLLAGFFLLSPVKYVSAFPAKFILAAVVMFFLGSHIRDMKDIEGDRKAGIRTVPVLFGDKWGPRIVGAFAALALLLVPVFMKMFILFASAIPSALAIYYFVNRKPYKEKYVFGTYFIFVFFSALLLLV